MPGRHGAPGVGCRAAGRVHGLEGKQRGRHHVRLAGWREEKIRGLRPAPASGNRPPFERAESRWFWRASLSFET